MIREPKFFVTTQEVLGIPLGATLEPDLTTLRDDIYRYIGKDGLRKFASTVEMEYFPDAFEETYPNCQAILRAFGGLLEGRQWVTRHDHVLNFPFYLPLHLPEVGQEPMPPTTKLPLHVAKFEDSGKEDECHRPIFNLVNLS